MTDSSVTPSPSVERPRPHKTEEGWPTRADQRYWTAAEWAIFEAVQKVEVLGASEALTKAVVLLHQARDLVADHVEEIP